MCKTLHRLRSVRSVAGSALLAGVVLFLLLAGSESVAAQSGNLYLPIVVTNDGSASPPIDTVVRLPANFAELIVHNTETGVWTEEEGIIRTLEFFAGKRSLSDLPGGADLPAGEGTGVESMAVHYLRNGADATVKAEINRLRKLILPPKANLDHYAAPIPTASSLAATSDGSANSVERVNAQACADAWLQGLPDDLPAPGPCLYYAERTVFDNKPIKLRVYYSVDRHDDPKGSPYFEAALDAMEKSVIEYLRYGDMPDVTLIFAPLLANDFDTYGGAFSNAITDFGYDSCPIVMYKFGELGIEKFKQGVAHEIFHCFQGANLAAQSEPSYAVRDWWSEGSASYFSNVVYPETNLEHRWLDKFNRVSATMWLQGMSYENSLFFQYVGNKKGNDWIIRSMLKAMPTNAGSGEIDQAKKLAALGLDLHQFGQEFLDGTIKDSSGAPVPTGGLPLVYTNPKPLKFLNAGDIEARGAFVFLLARYPLVYHREKIYTQKTTVSAAEHSVKSLLVADEWEPLAPELRSRCSGPTEMVLLVTSTDVDSRSKLNHFTNEITVVEERQCSCYFEASLGGAQIGFYAGPAHYETQNAPLEVLAFDPAFPSTWTANFSLADYATGTTGSKPVLGFSLLDSANSLFVLADPENPGRLSATITRSLIDFVEGRIFGEVVDPSSGGTVTIEAHFGATLALSEVADACDREWEIP